MSPDKLRAMIPYLCVIFAVFLIMPAAASFFTPEADSDYYLNYLLIWIFFPGVSIISGIIYGIKNTFTIFLPVFTFLLFLPTCFLFYVSSYWMYGVIYGGFSAAGVIIGRIFSPSDPRLRGPKK